MLADAVVIEVRKIRIFDVWLRKLNDRRAKERIVARLRNLTINQFGDVRSLGGGLFELRIDYGPGYRIYAARGSQNVEWMDGQTWRVRSRSSRRLDSTQPGI
jgi:putative addiction module killer protein